jgi:hypothetical protein
MGPVRRPLETASKARRVCEINQELPRVDRERESGDDRAREGFEGTPREKKTQLDSLFEHTEWVFIHMGYIFEHNKEKDL